MRHLPVGELASAVAYVEKRRAQMLRTAIERADGTLAGETIASVVPVALSHMYQRPQSWSQGVIPGMTTFLVRVRTTGGQVGIGESYAGSFAPDVASQLVRVYGQSAEGRRVDSLLDVIDGVRAAMFHWGRGSIEASVLGALETALLDVIGKLSGHSISALVSEVSDSASIPVYASGGMVGGDSVAAELEAQLSAGHLRTKIRASGSTKDDLERLQELSSAIALDSVAFDLVEGSVLSSVDVERAVERASVFDGLGLLWLEEPIRADMIGPGSDWIRELNTPIAGGESAASIGDLVALALGGCSVIQPDATWLPGIPYTIACAEWLQGNYGVNIVLHCWGGGSSVAANLSAAFATRSISMVEMPWKDSPLLSGLLTGDVLVSNGRAHAGETTVGLGATLAKRMEEDFPFDGRARPVFIGAEGGIVT